MADKLIIIKVKGMTCEGCVNNVKRALAAVPGVKETEVDLPGKKATIQFDGEKADAEKLKKTIIEAGYSIG
ncbi:MAG: heavy-metal-associated domain-containing protein [Candidatus Hydrothermarchaeaceae archaeon]